MIPRSFHLLLRTLHGVATTQRMETATSGIVENRPVAIAMR
jgi:hypothetical protein